MTNTRLALILLVVVSAACGGSSGGSSPRPPTSPTPPSSAATWSIGGVVTDAITGQGVPGATLAFVGRPSTVADANGTWRLQGDGASPGTSVLVSTITAPGYLERVTRVEWKASGRTDVALSLLPDRSPFSLAFFRELVRNAYDEPTELEPVRRWTSAPNFYLNAHNPRTSQKLVASEVEMIERTIREVVPQITGGQLSAGLFEVGVEPRAQRPGFININIVYEPDADFCGQAYVGSDPGEIDLNYDRCRVIWCREALAPSVIAHEVGHAMGLWHVAEGVMTPQMDSCTGTTFSEDERLHARIAYQRPTGNTDVDIDPPAFRAFTPGNTPRVRCIRVPRR